MFFQHNPGSPTHEDIHWGHLSSADLVTWHEHPVAFGPATGAPDEFGSWSGVFVTGLGRPAVAYSGVATDDHQSTVCLRYGDESLEHWTAPRVVARTPHHAGVAIMRDPFVFERDGRRWALLGARLDDRRPAVLLFSCDDIEAWSFVGVWLTTSAAVDWSPWPADIWECPQLVEVDGVPSVILSLQLDLVLGDVVTVEGDLVDGAGGPRFVPREVTRLDEGNRFYAPQVADDDGSPLMFGWVRQGENAGRPDGPFGCLSFPRRLVRQDGRLRLRLDPAVNRLRAGSSTPLKGPLRVVMSNPAVLDRPRRDPRAPADITLVGDDCAVAVPDQRDSSAWVDGDVLELFPGEDGTPSTVRTGDGRPWLLVVPKGHAVTLTELVRPTPG